MLYLAGLASALYWPGISGAATSPRWAVLAIIPWLITWQRATIVHWIGALFVAWAGLTMAWNPAPLDGINALFLLLIGAACFCLGDGLFDLRKIWIGAGIGIGLSSVAAIAQFFGYRGIAGLMPIHGLFVNENYMTEAAALVLVAVISERLWYLVPCVLPALLLGQGRGGILAAAAPFLIKYRRHPLALAAIATAIIGTVAVVTLHKDSGSMPERLQIWIGALHGVNFFGHGIGSFWTQYPAFDLRVNPPGNPETAHNEFITIAFELGVPGLILSVAFVWALVMGPLSTARMVLIAFLVEAFFAFPAHLPTTAFLGMVAAGAAVWDCYLVRNFADVRRALGWALRAAAVRGVGAKAYPRRQDHAVRPPIPRIPSLKGAV